ncbi:hypothetical protein CIB93_09055 [Streptomyces sp. WZ.A104]|uniref:hypothetical protein n=1 Tax=Streptomyces sp. WZ.A104 TaxID=2023771 RepID=UPI000BBC77C5|nr:hypothetical protein [Streptomyces sp. WZ.A104]PCG86370.1 hypothetical protein CIB93_09055 [Streptomyces sp. WZ.A104]
MKTGMQGVSLAKVPSGYQPSVEEWIENLTSRLELVARELDAARVELAVRRESEDEMARVALEVALENEVLRLVVGELGGVLVLGV